MNTNAITRSDLVVASGVYCTFQIASNLVDSFNSSYQIRLLHQKFKSHTDYEVLHGVVQGILTIITGMLLYKAVVSERSLSRNDFTLKLANFALLAVVSKAAHHCLYNYHSNAARKKVGSY